MARAISEIQAQMNTELAAQQTAGKLTNLTSASQVAVYKLWIYIIAVAISVFEQLQDVFKTEIEDFAATIAPATPSWVKDKVEKFQYDANTPQVIQLVEFVPEYVTVDEDKRIITRCSVKTANNKTVNVKVAKDDPPVQLTTPEQNALEGYLDNILPAGVQRNVINLVSDKLWIDATIYYNGQYAASIQADVIAAINAYLVALPFDGIVKISGIEDTIQAVEGVTDIVIDEVRARANTIAFTSASTVARYWETVAGYCISETTAGQTIQDTLTFTVANN